MTPLESPKSRESGQLDQSYCGCFFIASERIDENHCCHHDLDDHDGVDRLGEEHEWATTELRNSLRSIEWDLEDLEDTVQVVQDHANHANLDDQ